MAQEETFGKLLIEDTFPVREISEASSREKSIHHGHISTLHLWWARRPLAASRATNLSALLTASDVSSEKDLRNFIMKFSQWENSNNEGMVNRARQLVLSANQGLSPKVLDPFAGGGSGALEALRLNCDTFASDYNPVATLILKCTLQYAQKFRNAPYHLVKDVRRWSEWVFEQARKEIAKFYELEVNAMPIAFHWSKTIPCQNPTCGAEIPLLLQFWLARSPTKKVALYPTVSGKQINFKIVGRNQERLPPNFDPDKGTLSRAIVTCPACGTVIDDKTTRSLFISGRANERLVAISYSRDGKIGKDYRIANKEDVTKYDDSAKALVVKRNILSQTWGLDPIPDEPTPEGRGRGAERAFSLRNYNRNVWGDLFNARQKLAIVTFTEKVREVYEQIRKEESNEEYCKAVTTYLAMILDRLISYNTSNAHWHVTGEKATPIFGRQAIGMVWDYAETNPFSDSFGWHSQAEWVIRCIEHLCSVPMSPARVVQGSATHLPYESASFDAVFTDPPYYDNVPYSYLSDFFYVWLKRSVGSLYPDLFATPQTPKSEEIVAYSNMPGGFEAGKQFFEEMLGKSFLEIHRILKEDGVAVIVYAHKSTAGWETLINSLMDSGLVVTAAWPIHTEMKGRLRASESAALASSIYMVSRKIEKQPTGFYNEIKQKLRNHLNSTLDKLWNQGVSGADFFISAIGSSLEVIGGYEKIIDEEGNRIKAEKLLEDIRRIVTDYAVKQVLHNGFAAEITQMTRFYVLWRWAYGSSKLEFDDAKKLAQGVGIDLPSEWNKGFIKKDKEFIEILGPDERKASDLSGSRELIDVLHHSLLLWKANKNEDLIKLLKETGFGKNDAFYRVAQAVSESLPNESKEKKLLEGFVLGRDRISRDVGTSPGQTRLFEE